MDDGEPRADEQRRAEVQHSAADQYWFNPTSREVERGKQGPWMHRMGPYATREEAEQALATAQDRSQEWDEDDRRRQEDDRLWQED